jgi:hypothetical protein
LVFSQTLDKKPVEHKVEIRGSIQFSLGLAVPGDWLKLTKIPGIDKLMEIIVGLGVNTNTLNVKYQTTGGINTDGTFVEGSFQKIFDKLKYGDKHSVLGQVSSVNQMESVTYEK